MNGAEIITYVTPYLFVGRLAPELMFDVGHGLITMNKEGATFP